ncbi:cyclic nucleotide-gated ion channel-like isoform 2-T2 [Glossina fuscipes fuscipes]
MKLSVSAYRSQAAAHKKILSGGYHSHHNYGSTEPPSVYEIDINDRSVAFAQKANETERHNKCFDDTISNETNRSAEGDGSPNIRKSPRQSVDDSGSSSNGKSPSIRGRTNQRWMKLRTTVQISSAMQKKPPLKREDSFLKRFSTRQTTATQETIEDTGSEGTAGDVDMNIKKRRRYLQNRRSVVNPDENFYFYWLMALTICVLYNLWTLIVRQSFPELEQSVSSFWLMCDVSTDIVFIFDILVQLRTGYLEQGLMVYDDKKLACHYVRSRDFILDLMTLIPLDLLQIKMGSQPLLRFTRFFKVYRSIRFYYIVESRTVWPNLWRVVNLIHILLILAHWFGCFYYLLSEAESFQGDWVYPYRPGDYATLTRKYLGSLYWSTLTLTTIGDLPTPETNAEPNFSVDGPRSIPRRGIKSRLLQFGASYGYIFTIISYLIGVFIFATIVGQVGNVITNRNANRLEFERLLDGAKTYMRHHKVPGGMKRRVLRWYDYSWSRGRIQGGGDINTALGLLPDKLKTELALHVNLSVLKKVTIFQECQPEFLHDLVLKMKAYIFTPGDSICRKGEVAREMFIIADGILEVLSETGKVLTTMKAGDFFGEIGILNLDGLNKRTADVRSVGYSELFSLSREDVLTAMKDYPDAQEILQTLGRKRLMEVRCVNKKYAKSQTDKQGGVGPRNRQKQLSYVTIQNDNSGENAASKKVDDKLKNDVKELINVLKKSRNSRLRNEAIEMQHIRNLSPKNCRSEISQMPCAFSEETDEKLEEKIEKSNYTSSPIGAGLPLLQRLRLLKEKQDREQRASVSTLASTPTNQTHATCTIPSQESIQEEPEGDAIEGFTFTQHLQQQIGVKNETPPLIGLKLKTSSNCNKHNNAANTSILSVAQIKPIMKVSFRKNLNEVKQCAADRKIAEAKSMMVMNALPKKQPPNTLLITKSHIIEERDATAENGASGKSYKPIATISNKIDKLPPAKISVLSDLDTPTKPWSKLKIATLSSSYTSLATSHTSSEDVHSPVRNRSPENIKNVILKQNQSKCCEPLTYSTRRKLMNNTSKMQDRLKVQSLNRAKFYQSVFDLSPEYKRLPFVKRLKILNERQKIAELEKDLQVRSFSLDDPKLIRGLSPAGKIYRCQSDTSGINTQTLLAYDSSSTTSTNTSTSENSKKVSYRIGRNRFNILEQNYLPLSPDNNEPERKHLKSILMKFNKTTDRQKQLEINEKPSEITYASLQPFGVYSREPTLEGFTGTSNSASNFELFECKQSEDKPSSVSFSNDHLTPLLYDQLIKKNKTCSKTKCENHLHSCSNSKNQHSYLDDIEEGFPGGQQYFDKILNGINTVIHAHISEMQSKFESQFTNMALEMKRRDAIIAHLKTQLTTVSLNVPPSSSLNKKISRDHRIQFTEDDLCSGDASSSTSSAEPFFMRGDSLDTVFTSSPPTLTSNRLIASPKSSRFKNADTFTYPKKQLQNETNACRKEYRNLQQSQMKDKSIKLTPTTFDNTVVDMDDSSNSSSSTEKFIHDQRTGYHAKDEDINSRKNYQGDWEVKMLAAEMEKQERKVVYSPLHSFLRKRRKFSDTDTECAETETTSTPHDVTIACRSRAYSLDQFTISFENESRARELNVASRKNSNVNKINIKEENF